MLVDVFTILITTDIQKISAKLEKLDMSYCHYKDIDLVHTQLTYPTAKEFILVDKKELNISFIETLAHKFHYQIKDIEDKDFTIRDLTRYKTSFLSTTYQYLVVGDVHGCIDELKTLLIKKGFEIDHQGYLSKKESCKIILLGDFIDKGSDEKIKDTIEFIYQNRDKIILIKGNHEDKVYRYLQGVDESLFTPKALKDKKKYYNSALLFERDNELKAKFLELYNESFIWLEYAHDENFSMIFTHAPCKLKYLKKMDFKSQHNMVKSKSRSKHKGVKLDDLISYIHQEAKDNQYYHIFGHLSQENIREYKNKICIDTSAIYGNVLSAIYLKKDEFKFYSVPFQSKQEKSKQEYNVLFDFYKS